MKHAASNYSTPGLRLILSFLLKVSLPAHLLYLTTLHCLPTIDAHLGWGCYTLLTSLLLFLLHILSTHLLSIYHLHRASTLHSLPIPSTSGKWPGNVDLLKKWIGIWKNGYPGDIAGRLMVQLGGVETYAVKMCWKNTVFTADPEVIREMLTVDHANYIKGRALTDALHSVLGSGVFNTNGDLWRFHRSMSRPFFTRERLRGMVPVFVDHADRAMERLVERSEWSERMEGGESGAGKEENAPREEENTAPVDIQDLASKFTLDAATEFLFGSCVHSLEEELPGPWNAQPVAASTLSSPSNSIEEKPTRSTFSMSSTSTSSPLLPTSGISHSTAVPTNSSQSRPSPQSSYTSSSPTQAFPTAFPTAFTSALSTLASRLRSGALWPLLEITKDSTRKDVGVIRGFVRGIVQGALERREERERMGVDVKEGETLLDHLVTVSDDIQLIQDELINILIAGRDTTASCITFATYLLTQHPEVLQRLSEEVHSVLGDASATESSTNTDSTPNTTNNTTPNTNTTNTAKSTPNNTNPSLPTPTLESLKAMPYLRAVINETLRLFPSVPMNVRDSISERVLTTSDGTRLYLPAGTGITYSLLHLHRSPKYWGPTASLFDPVRFLPTMKGSKEGQEGQEGGGGGGGGGDGRYEAYYAKTPFVFMPFNAGPRSCLGQQLAYAEVGVFLCRLVQRLRVRQRLRNAGGEVGLKLSLDEEAIPPACRVPRSWSEAAPLSGTFTSSPSASPSLSPSTSPSTSPTSPFQYSGWRDDKHPSSPSSSSLPLHISPSQLAFAGATPGSMLPATTSTGESPRKRIERVWPKSHLTMFVEGGVWIRV